MDKTAILETANNLLTGPRADSYGDFGEQMESIARMFNGLKGCHALSSRDVAEILILLKLKRLDVGWDVDSAIDLCGYAALTGDKFCNENKG